MVQVLRHCGYTVIFLVVLAESLGLPVPSFPFILIGAALAAELHFHLAAVVALSVLSALSGDSVWYLLGKLRGRSILRKLCSLSLSPDSCVGRTEDFFGRNGLKTLLFAKFIPGLATVASPLAGMLNTSYPRFVLFDLGGICLWVTSAVLLGLGFRAQVEWLLGWLGALGRTSALILTLLLAGWFLLRWFERRRFFQLLEKSRISPQDLKRRLAQGENLVIVDLRSDLAYQQQGSRIPGAIHIPPGEFHRRNGEIPKDRPVVMYCT
jgi:membrane protein DedA with SNARE-associated domain